MRRAGSLILAAGDKHKLPAGGALAVDRDAFSAEVTARLSNNPLVTIARGEIDGLPPADWANVIIATGPLTSPALSAALAKLTGEEFSPSSTPSPRSFTATASTRRSRGFSHATTRPVPAARAQTISIVQ